MLLSKLEQKVKDEVNDFHKKFFKFSLIHFNVPFRYAAKLKFDAFCKMDFRQYPLDTQVILQSIRLRVFKAYFIKVASSLCMR